MDKSSGSDVRKYVFQRYRRLQRKKVSVEQIRVKASSPMRSSNGLYAVFVELIPDYLAGKADGLLRIALFEQLDEAAMTVCKKLGIGINEQMLKMNETETRTYILIINDKQCEQWVHISHDFVRNILDEIRWFKSRSR